MAPVSESTILTGYVVGGMSRGLLVGVIVTFLSLFFSHLRVEHVVVTIIMVIFTSVVFSIAGFINAVYAQSFDDISIIPTFVLTPMIYLGGVFYSIDLLPSFWQGVSLLNPILYMVNGFRYGILGVSDVSLHISMLMLMVFLVLGYGYAYYLLAKAKKMRQ